MATRKEGAYGKAAASDTDFRKTWDADEYAAKAKAKDDARREEAKLRYEAKLEGKTYHKYVDPSTLSSTSARDTRLDVASMVGKSSLVPAGSGVGKRGRGAGFYCEACDLTYKDNVQYIEHLNSKGHLVNTGQSGEVVRATVEDVRDKIDELIVRKRGREEEERRAGEVDVQKRIRGAEEREERDRKERRERRNEKRRKGKGGEGVKREEDGGWEERLGVIA